MTLKHHWYGIGLANCSKPFWRIEEPQVIEYDQRSQIREHTIHDRTLLPVRKNRYNLKARSTRTTNPARLPLCSACCFVTLVTSVTSYYCCCPLAIRKTTAFAARDQPTVHATMSMQHCCQDVTKPGAVNLINLKSSQQDLLLHAIGLEQHVYLHIQRYSLIATKYTVRQKNCTLLFLQ